MTIVGNGPGRVTAPDPVRGAADPSRLVNTAKGATGFAVLLLIWEALRVFGVLPATAAPAGWDIVSSLADAQVRADLGAALVDTVVAWAVGLAAAGLAGVTLGAAIGLSRWADAGTRVVAEFLRPIPAVALIPLAIVLLGIDVTMQSALVAFACLWPLLISTRFGVRNVDPLLVETGRTLGAAGVRLIASVTWPAAVPAILTGLRTAASLAVVVAVATELVAGSPGLGTYIAQQQQAGAIAASYAGVVAAGLLGYAINALLVGFERLTVGRNRPPSAGAS